MASRTLHLVVSALLAASLAACSSSPPRIQGTELELRYATVSSVERVDMPSVAPVGAILGGFTGLALSRNRSFGSQVAAGVGGAALGGLATRALEGDNRGYAYNLRYRNGEPGRFITEKGYLRRGDCVLVERGQHANVRRVDASYCANSDAPTETHVTDATQCNQAKQQLLDAETDAAIEAAAKKVELLCRFQASR